jgi:hypothetical protein
MARRLRFPAGLAIAAATLLAAGCGGEPELQLYRLEPTRDCLEDGGGRVTTDDLDFVASTAGGGAFRAEVGENQLTISFGEQEEDAVRTAQAYRDFAGPTIPIDHVLARNENAVMVWNTPPTDGERAQVVACLSG